MANQRFLDRSIKLNNDNEVSFPMLMIMIMGIVYVFGATVITSLFTVQVINYILFFGTAYLVMHFIKRGVVRSMRDIVVFAIVFPTAIGFANRIPTYLDRYADSTTWQAEFNEIENNYTGKVDMDSLFNSNEMIEADSNAGGGVPTTAQVITYAEPVVTSTEQGSVEVAEAVVVIQPTVDVLGNRQRETQSLLDSNLISQAYDKAEATYVEFGDSYSFDIMASIDQARNKKQERLTKLPVATDSTASFMSGGEAERVKALLAGNQYEVVLESGDFGWFGCQKNIIIEQTNGYMSGSQYEAKLCTLEQFTEIKVGSTFEVR